MKYKLIKKYPGSPEIGTIFTMYNGYKSDYYLMPEFWQIIEEPLTKEEIMQECIKRFPKGSKVKCPLHGDIYTIAQKFTAPRKNDWFEGVYYYGSHGNILAVVEGKSQGLYLYTNGKYAELVEEPKQVLFKTEDGFNVHYDDKVYGVYLPTLGIQEYCWESKFRVFKDTSLSKDVKYFFKKENAQDYVLNNVEKLSINDVLDTLEQYRSTPWTIDYGNNLVNDLKNVVKSKI